MSRYGIIFNVDRCIGCEACFVACKEENKVAPGIQWNKIRLINGTRKPYITHSKTRSDAPYLLELEPVSTIHMNPADAKKRGLVTGDFVEMRSKFGGPVRARIDVSIIVPEGTIDSQYGWRGDQNTQNLIPRQWDPISGYAPYFEVNVSVAKVK